MKSVADLSYVVVEWIFKNERNSLLGILGGFPINKENLKGGCKPTYLTSSNIRTDIRKSR